MKLETKFKPRCRWSTLILIVICLCLLQGCENGTIVFTDEARMEVKLNAAKQGEARKLFFVNCMELSAKITRQGDDDVSDIVSECRYVAWNLNRYLRD